MRGFAFRILSESASLETLFLRATIFPGHQPPALPRRNPMRVPPSSELQATGLESPGNAGAYQAGSFSDDITDFTAHLSVPLCAALAPLAFLLFSNIPSSFSPRIFCTCYSLYLDSSIPPQLHILLPHLIQPSLITQLKMSISPFFLLLCV